MFPSYIVNKSILSPEQLDELFLLLNIDNKSYKTSHVYDKNKKVNILNKHLRSSEKIEYTDTELFDFIDNTVIKAINAGDNDNNYYLIRNDLEVVKYRAGDYFKKHQDYINFNSNAFKNYTFLICLKPCEEGGETVLYLDFDNLDIPTVIEETGRTAGALLLFQKDIVHEGREILKGEKYILKGNLLCFQKPKIDDLYVVTFSKLDRYYVIAASDLHDNTIYKANYSFQKSQNKDKDKHIYFYEESYVQYEHFTRYYQDNYSTSEEYIKMLDYIGGKMPSFIDLFGGNDKQEITICTMNEYYNMLDLKLPDNVIPFQYISLETNGIENIIWFGVYDNRLVTLDVLDSSGNNHIDEDYEDDEQNISFKTLEEIEVLMYELTVETYFKYRSISNSFKKEEPAKKDLRNKIRSKYCLKPLSAFNTSKSEDKHEQMTQFITSIIDGLSSEKTENECYIYKPMKNRDYKNLTQYTNDILIGNDKYLEIIKLNLDEIIADIQKYPMISTIINANASEYYCNETHYMTMNVIHKFGFIKHRKYLE